MILIDGAFGEGGGQILRYSAALAAATGKTVRVVNIRANRPNPGLRPQHLSSLKILQMIFGGSIEGLRIGSTEVVIRLDGPKPGRLTYDIGTAGSISLVMQSLVPALVLADSESEITLIGGTDVKWSPTIDYMRYVYTSIIKKFGPVIHIDVLKRGYYPVGGGKVRLRVVPSGMLDRVKLLDRGGLDEVLIRSVVSRLPQHIIHRQADAALKTVLRSGLRDLENIIKVEKEHVPHDKAGGPGTSILVVARHSEGLYCGGDSIGERGKPAEKVGEDAAKRFLGWLKSGAVLDRYVGDMIIPFMALSEGGGVYTVSEFTRHMESALYVVEKILGVEYTIEKISGSIYKVEIR
jgi:RNA 3'-terminal phosphate cyclase (ATP)